MAGEILHRTFTSAESRFLMDRQLTKRWDAFAETPATFQSQEGPGIGGTLARPGNDAPAFDLHVGVGLSSAAMEHFVGSATLFAFMRSIVSRRCRRGRRRPPTLGSKDVTRRVRCAMRTWLSARRFGPHW